MQRLIASGSEDVAAFSQAVDVLLESKLAFQEQSLGGGEWQVTTVQGQHLLRAGLPPDSTSHQTDLAVIACWLRLQVVYTRGRLLWQQITSPGRAPAVGRLSYKSKRKASRPWPVLEPCPVLMHLLVPLQHICMAEMPWPATLFPILPLAGCRGPQRMPLREVRHKCQSRHQSYGWLPPSRSRCS